MFASVQSCLHGLLLVYSAAPTLVGSVLGTGWNTAMLLVSIIIVLLTCFSIRNYLRKNQGSVVLKLLVLLFSATSFSGWNARKVFNCLQITKYNLQHLLKFGTTHSCLPSLRKIPVAGRLPLKVSQLLSFSWSGLEQREYIKLYCWQKFIE